MVLVRLSPSYHLTVTKDSFQLIASRCSLNASAKEQPLNLIRPLPLPIQQQSHKLSAAARSQVHQDDNNYSTFTILPALDHDIHPRVLCLPIKTLILLTSASSK